MDIKKLAAAAVCCGHSGKFSNTSRMCGDGRNGGGSFEHSDKRRQCQHPRNMLYRGVGMVSGNNSSRLLLDYKSENPDAYWEIMNYIFGKNGLEVAHLKLEMGSDINSSSGTEPFRNAQR